MKHLNQSGGFLGVFPGTGGSNSAGTGGTVTPGGLGTIGGGMTSIPRPNRPIFGPRPIPRPTPGGRVPYHTHTIETSGPIYGGGRPGRPIKPIRPNRPNRPIFPRPPFFGRPRTGGPTPVGTVGAIAGQYANASGSCSLWMCSNDEY